VNVGSSIVAVGAMSVGVRVGRVVAVGVSSVGSGVAVSRGVLVGNAVGESGMMPVPGVSVGVGERMAGNVGGVTMSPSLGAFDRR
jgi:hypothetical protein